MRFYIAMGLIVFSVLIVSVNAQLPNLQKIGSIVGVPKPTVEQLPALKEGNSNDPTADKTLDRFIVNDPKSTETITVTVTLLGLCGMERDKGLQVSYSRNGLGGGYGYCESKTNYLLMKMKEEKQKEQLMEAGSVKASDGQSWFNSILVMEPKPQVRIEIKTQNIPKAIIKTYDFPFEVKSYNETVPRIVYYDKSLWKSSYLDNFKTTDLTGEEWFTVVVEKILCTMDQIPCIQISIGHNNLVDGMVYLTKADVENRVKAGKGGEVLFEERTYSNRGWGPGPQYYKVFATKEKVRVVVKTKTGGKELIKEYPLSL